MIYIVKKLKFLYYLSVDEKKRRDRNVVVVIVIIAIIIVGWLFGFS